MIRHGANDKRIRFEMRDRIQATLKYLDSEYGTQWTYNKRALADPRLLALQLWLDKFNDGFNELFDRPDYQVIYKLRMQGKGQAEIRDITGYSLYHVMSRIKTLKDHGMLDDAQPIIKRKKVQSNRNLKYRRPPKQTILNLLDRGLNKTAMAEELGVGRKIVYRWLEEFGLTEYAKKNNWKQQTC